MDYYVLDDGSYVGTLNGLPYNFHPAATPEQWDWIAEEIKQGRARLIDAPIPAEPTEEELQKIKLSVEVSWRTSELLVIERQLQATEEDEAGETPPDLMPGARRQWLKYRGQVSNWKEGIDPFPNSELRPVFPA